MLRKDDAFFFRYSIKSYSHSRPKVILKIAILKIQENSQEVTQVYMHPSCFNLTKNELYDGCFPANYSCFFIEHLRWLLLNNCEQLLLNQSDAQPGSKHLIWRALQQCRAKLSILDVCGRPGYASGNKLIGAKTCSSFGNQSQVFILSFHILLFPLDFLFHNFLFGTSFVELQFSYIPEYPISDHFSS